MRAVKRFDLEMTDAMRELVRPNAPPAVQIEIIQLRQAVVDSIKQWPQVPLDVVSNNAHEALQKLRLYIEAYDSFAHVQENARVETFFARLKTKKGEEAEKFMHQFIFSGGKS
jgi:hypothetical protein